MCKFIQIHKSPPPKNTKDNSASLASFLWPIVNSGLKESLCKEGLECIVEKAELLVEENLVEKDHESGWRRNTSVITN